MKVLHFILNFSPLSETFIYDYIKEQEKQGVTNVVLTLRRESESERPHERIQVVTLPSKFLPRRIFYKLRKILLHLPNEDAYRNLYRKKIQVYLKKIRPDIIHAQFGPAGDLIAPAAAELNIPLVVTFHGYDVSKLTQLKNWKRRYIKLFETGSLFIGVSNFICDRLVELGAPRSKVVLAHNGINVKKFKYSQSLTRFDGKSVKCLHVGRLVPKKDPIRLVEAFALARKRLKNKIDLKLIIVGDGPLQDALKLKVKELHVNDHVTLLGALRHERIAELLNEVHVYVQHCVTASDGDQEGIGVTFAEASACGLPIVATRHNGIPDVVLENISGFLADEGDVDGMANYIVKMCQEPKLWDKFGRAGRAHIEKNFCLEAQVSKVNNLLSRVLTAQSNKCQIFGG